ncbi:MAG: glycosyltransferase family 2 protein [Alphaproteobacteria bacterium]
MNAEGKVPISVVIPTRNEERNLAACLAGLEFAAERVVFDSHSDDATLDIARAAGARVVQRHFDVFSRHKNWALDNIDFAHDWILLVDADERVTPELAAEIAAVVRGGGPEAGWYIARKNIFQGRWIRHAGMYPDWQLRLVRRGRARYEDRIVHEYMVADGPTGFLKTPFVHHDYKGIERYIDRHNHYSSLEAVEIHRLLAGRAGASAFAGRLAGSGPERRRALKLLAYRHLPARALILFFYMYVLRFGFLDGRIGFRYCLLRSIYEYQIALKLIELRDPHSPLAVRYREYIER